MAKLPTIKFPRITAGFYGITMDGEFVGYVMKDVDLDSKETNWYVFDDNVQGKDVAMLTPADAIDSPDALLREAKDSAKNYFLNRPVKVEAISPVSPLKESEWVEEETEDEDLEPSAEDLLEEELIEDDNLYVSDDGEFEAFEDELELDLDNEEVHLEELALV
jgi:hypothetical protein